MSMDLPLSLTVPDRRSAEVPAIWLRIHETAKRVARWMAAFVHLERGDLPVRSHLFGREPISTSDGVRDRAIDVLRDHHERVLAHPRRIWAAAHSFTVLRRLLTSVNKPSTTAAHRGAHPSFGNGPHDAQGTGRVHHTDVGEVGRVQEPAAIQIVPLTRTLRGYASEVTVSADATNGLMEDSAAQCQHVRAVASARIRETLGNVGPVSMAQIRDVLAVLLDL